MSFRHEPEIAARREVMRRAVAPNGSYPPTRPEAIHRLVELGAEGEG